MNFTSHPALYKVTTDNSEWCDSPDMMCASRALDGRSGIARVHMAVDWILVPSGNFTVSRVIARWTLVIAANNTKK